MSDIEFVNGLSVKARHDKAPDYVLANGSINCEQLTEWLLGRTGWINWQAKLSKAGNPYVSVDNWKPKEKTAPVPNCPQDNQGNSGEFVDDDLGSIPF